VKDYYYLPIFICRLGYNLKPNLYIKTIALNHNKSKKEAIPIIIFNGFTFSFLNKNVPFFALLKVGLYLLY
jgi:hypothetical protein